MVQLFRTDLQFILDQIILAESGGLPPTAFHPWGLRSVNGANNHLIPGQEAWGSADQVFPRLLNPLWRSAGNVTIAGLPGQALGSPTSYSQTSGFVFDPQIRMISNLIVDQTANNPAAVDANGGNAPVISPGLDGHFGDDPNTPQDESLDDREVFFIANTAPDEGLSAPFNSWFTLFGQFFDHGLDLVNKGGSGTVFVPLMPDDPLYDFGGDGIVNADMTASARTVLPTQRTIVRTSCMLTRATNRPGADGILGTADDIREHNNQTTPFVDQNQTYTSHPAAPGVPARVCARRERAMRFPPAVSSMDRHGGLATWG